MLDTGEKLAGRRMGLNQIIDKNNLEFSYVEVICKLHQ